MEEMGRYSATGLRYAGLYGFPPHHIFWPGRSLQPRPWTQVCASLMPEMPTLEILSVLKVPGS